jgi:protein-disulfide isomerase
VSIRASSVLADSATAAAGDAASGSALVGDTTMSTLGRARAALEIVSTATVIAAAAMLLWTLVADQSTAASGARTRIESVDARIEAADIRNRKGAAEVAIVEFADYECPFCRTHAQDVFPRVQRELIQPGQAEYVFVNFPLDTIHPLARRAKSRSAQRGRGDIGRCMAGYLSNAPRCNHRI